ncbi:colicin V synthesis protein [Erwinia sp.]|uniref:colicin V synthesis protein n=1 Tax=Erwinia citreus TaxID=558 RepID=UPI003C76C98A
MRELTSSEVSDVSGAEGIGEFVFDRLKSSVFGSVAAAMTGGTIGYLRGGDAMGIFGLSIIGQLVGAVGAGIIGGIGGAVGGLLVPFSWSYPLAISALQNVVGGGIK